MFDVRNLTVSIRRTARDVYAFASDGENLPRWASGLGGSVAREGDDWIVDGPLGRIRVRMAARNPLGVLDHDVTLPSGQTVHNPMRVMPNDDGATVLFTLFRLPEVTYDKLDEDTRWVERDLAALKRVLETT